MMEPAVKRRAKYLWIPAFAGMTRRDDRPPRGRNDPGEIVATSHGVNDEPCQGIGRANRYLLPRLKRRGLNENTADLRPAALLRC